MLLSKMKEEIMIEEDARKRIYETDELDVVIGKTQVIISAQERKQPCGFVFKLANGDLIVGGAMSGVVWPAPKIQLLPQGQTTRELSWRRSIDGGQTWNETLAWPSYGACQLPNNEIIQISARMWRIENQRDFTTMLFRSTDDGYTFEGKKVLITGVPKLLDREVYDNSDKERLACIYGHIVRLRDGSLLVAAQGKFDTDIRYRTFVIQSYDRGKTWRYISSVAFDLAKNKLRLEGFAEPSLLVLPDDDILCFMRSSGIYGNIGALYMSRSRDNGQSWSHADPVADCGVYPTACLMANGVIAVIYGRPGDWLAFSLDKGNTWINHFCFNRTPEPYDCGNYDWIEEVAPDTLLAVYSRTDPNDCMKSEIMGTYFTVKPKKKA
jgi:hypothetical protein